MAEHVSGDDPTEQAVALSEEDIDDIIYCCRAGELEAMSEYFKEQGLDPGRVFTEIYDAGSGSMGLHMAAANGHVDIIDYIFKNVKDEQHSFLVNGKNNAGNTPLHWAAVSGQKNAAIRLCELGADAGVKNNAGHDAIYEAQIHSREDVVNALLERFNVEDNKDEQDEEEEQQDKHNDDGDQEMHDD